MSEFGTLIRSWRKSRGVSQLDLSLAANISSKHVSFLETGRAQPSREMVLQLSNSLDIPLSERNVLLSAAGFAEAYSRMDIEQPEMKAVSEALTIMLDNHAPYPALIIDWNWNIVMANEPYQKLAQYIIHQQPNFPTTDNILEMLFDPNGLRPFVENWEEVACVLLQRLRKEKIIHSDRGSTLIEKLTQYPDVPEAWSAHGFGEKSEPMIYLELSIGELRLKLFSTLASFGTAIDITMQELIIEQYFPVDTATKNFFEQQND